jgi:hypothetical protein|tara:strand:+ start:864 stop:1037 length:174 start_codon:yes stop_codon:yes gene_type:complete
LEDALWGVLRVLPEEGSGLLIFAGGVDGRVSCRLLPATTSLSALVQQVLGDLVAGSG